MAKFFKYTLLLSAISYVVVYIGLVFLRIRYPFELEWTEGGMLELVRRILSGKKLYVGPSLDFVAFIYTPLYFYVSAVISKITGVGFIPLRLVSFISSLGCFFFIFLIVRRETGSFFSGVIASFLFAATFRISGAWFDVARNDSLFLFLLLISLYLLKFGESAKTYVLAGVFISLSFLTKQTALVIFLPLAVYCIFLNRRQSVFFISTVVLIVGGSTLLLNYIHDGWYKYFVFDLPRQREDPLLQSMFIGFWTQDLMSRLPVACVMSIFYLLTQFVNSNKKNSLFYFFTAAGMLGSSYVVRLHAGGYDNVLFPAYAVISILFGLALHKLLELIQTTDKQHLLEIFIYLICLAQFFSLKYNPLEQIPTQNDLEAGEKLVASISQIKGEVFIPCCDYLSVLAGKRSFAHKISAEDVLRDKEGPIKDRLLKEIKQAIHEKRFSAIIIESRPQKFPPELQPPFFSDIEKHYIKHGAVFDNEDVFWQVTAMEIRPEFIYVPNDKYAK